MLSLPKITFKINSPLTFHESGVQKVLNGYDFLSDSWKHTKAHLCNPIQYLFSLSFNNCDYLKKLSQNGIKQIFTILHHRPVDSVFSENLIGEHVTVDTRVFVITY